MHFLQNFEDFVAGHFCKYGRNILVACRAYLEGAKVGCLVGKGIQDVDEGDKSCSVMFKHSLKRLFEELLMELNGKGADCDEFFTQKARSGSSGHHHIEAIRPSLLACGMSSILGRAAFLLAISLFLISFYLHCYLFH
jgi:hypothetical protein